MTRKIYSEINKVPKGSRVIAIRLKELEPSLIVVSSEKDVKEVVYPSDKECVWSNIKLIFVEITKEEREKCIDEQSINKLAIELTPEIAQQLGLKHYKVTR